MVLDTQRSSLSRYRISGTTLRNFGVDVPLQVSTNPETTDLAANGWSAMICVEALGHSLVEQKYSSCGIGFGSEQCSPESSRLSVGIGGNTFT